MQRPQHQHLHGKFWMLMQTSLPGQGLPLPYTPPEYSGSAAAPRDAGHALHRRYPT